MTIYETHVLHSKVEINSTEIFPLVKIFTIELFKDSSDRNDDLTGFQAIEHESGRMC